MCGILCVLGLPCVGPDERRKALQASKKLRHRGPDWSGIHTCANHIFCHERLSIVDVTHGGQPLFNEDKTVILCVNGEIYNHVALRKALKGEHTFATLSDCEVVLHMYEEMGAEFIHHLDGFYAIVLHDTKTGETIVTRDGMGIVPLYRGWSEDGAMWVGSELKAILEHCPKVEEFPTGCIYSTKTDEMKRWYEPVWWHPSYTADRPADLEQIRNLFEKSVIKRLMSDVPYGVLLSGGLDSSLVAAIAARHARKRVEDDEETDAWWPTLHSFCIGLEGSPDIKAAEEVAKFIGTVHHSFVFTEQEGLDAVEDVIYHLETYDVTTVRASTPMYLMARRIKAMGVKMVLSGEGSDEIFGGYLYFHKAPNGKEFHDECVRKVKALHQFDCLRANKSMSAFGVEPRVPFLDKEFLDCVLTTDATFKMVKRDTDDPRQGMEKYILRKAFDVKENPYLPESVLWRQKEQFSDGVGYGWIDRLRDHAGNTVTDEDLASAAAKFPVNTPATKEAYFYRSIFERHFPGEAAAALVPGGPSIACSTATAVAWDASFASQADPSGRSIGVHHESYASK